MSDEVLVAIIGAVPPVLVAIISIISNNFVVQTKMESLDREVSRIHWLEREHIEDARILNELLIRISKLEGKNENE